MITLCRARKRHHDRGRGHRAWLTFDAAKPFGTLESLDEARLSPSAGIPSRAPRDAEIVTYVREGALAYEDSIGRSRVVQAGEFRRLTAVGGIRPSERNASRCESAQVFQVWVRPAQSDLEPGCEQKRFSVAQRRSELCVIASSDGRNGSLRIHQDALIFSALLEPGQHVIRELAPGRSAWLHIVQGEAAVADLALTSGDGVGVTGECAISFTARAKTELLLLDLGAEVPGPTSNGGSP